MTPARALRLARAAIATLAVRALVRLRPQRWCPPTVTLRLLRLASETGTAAVAADVRRHLPPDDRSTRTDLTYAPGRDGTFDLVVPDGPGPHPLVVWVHGGGWHFGAKSDALPYLELLATRGYAGAAVNYPRAPVATYPAAPRAVNDALAHLLDHAAAYDLDPDRVVLAGDSAGAQVAAELAVLTTNPTYAARTTLTPALRPAQLRGGLFFCGIFDPTALDDSDRMFSAALESAMWALARRRSWRDSEACDLMSVLQHAGADFPPTFLAAGNADPLTRRQSGPFGARLRELGVGADEFAAGTEDEPAYHEFQFRLDTPDGVEAFERAVRFLDEVTGNSH